MNGSYEEIDGRPALRYERSFSHPIERVWRALSDPEELRHWFPAAVTMDFRPGGEMSFEFDDPEGPETSGQVTEVEPPRLFAFDWAEDHLRFELEPESDGCRLRFTHFLSAREDAARTAAGWDACLDQLDRHVAGEPAAAPGTRATSEWRERYDQYVESGVPYGAPLPDDH